MELFEIKNDQVAFSPQALLLTPFKAIWDRDKKKDKPLANTELAAVYFYMDYKSDFSTMLDDVEKLALIKSVIVGMPKEWEPDDIFNDACAFYQEMQETHSTLLLQDAQYAIASVRKFLRSLDMEERDERDKPIHDLKKVIDSLGSINKVTEALMDLEQQVKKQIQAKTDTARGGKEKALFEDEI
tara:strand:+ start:64 stop:618 length:555 start_codon:yes stop_codon:yes gene_type:complete